MRYIALAFSKSYKSHLRYIALAIYYKLDLRISHLQNIASAIYNTKKKTEAHDLNFSFHSQGRKERECEKMEGRFAFEEFGGEFGGADSQLGSTMEGKWSLPSKFLSIFICVC